MRFGYYFTIYNTLFRSSKISQFHLNPAANVKKNLETIANGSAAVVCCGYNVFDMNTIAITYVTLRPRYVSVTFC